MLEIYVVPSITAMFILLDILSGITQAFANKNISSEKLRMGLFHKMAFIFAIMLGYLIEYSMQFLDLGFNIPIATAVCVYVCVTEIVSIIENVVLLNPELNNTKFLNMFRVSTEEVDDQE